jgi:hypothetical protein
MSEIWSKPTRLAKALNELKQAKNDFKHDRGPKIEEDYVSATVKVGPLLDTCMQELAFLTEYPIRLIYDVKVVRGSRNVSLLTYRCTGDHPALPQEQLEYPEALPQRDLFIEVTGRRWIPLFPFVTAHNCPSCKTREIYFVDRWQGSGKAALLKSFERGHTEEKMDVGTELISWSRQSN